jgi:hypothetical protein
MPVGDGRIYHPTRKAWRETGGTPQGNAFASWDSWTQMLKFLDESINKK